MPTSKSRSLRLLLTLAGAAVLSWLTLGPAEAGASPSALTRTQYLSLAQPGIARTSHWANSKFHWYNELLNDPKPYPQATIWGVVPLFESDAYAVLASPTASNVSRLETFANHAELYWDRNVTPAPGASTKTSAYAPYPKTKNNAKTFFDDNAWWSVAFMDAYSAMQKAGQPTLASRYLADARRGFNFIYANGWDTHDAGGSQSVLSTPGGMWWNTFHQAPVSGGVGRSGEGLGAATELAALLYKATGKSIYLQAAEKYITWANQNLLKWDGSYSAVIPQEVVMPHDGEGALVAAYTALCQASAGAAVVPASAYSFLPPNKTHRNPSFRLPSDPTSWCSWAEALAHNSAFGVDPGGGVQDAFVPLTKGPQWDAIYVRGLLSLYAFDHDAAWYQVASDTAQQILSNAKSSNGLYLKTWTGSTQVPDAPAGDIRTHMASVSVLAALAAAQPPA